ncbi:hypothetical protein PROH_15935 [Prochlorothrix hollandica PCC 9006 = CALU 1027]|uniref:Uncharacterized protein n=1 Tax=Prochlorothrix hollandica PCC 9006 = CALU 1027 TaxID=317619 RepID=A0A0M2PRQ7_PROHO|nr:hypothetical protein PROH_15935 [Prochlorothrix hollandica PCC 9006 = CALU 1027]
MGESLFHLGRFPDFGRGNPPVVAPAVGREEGRHGGKNPTRGRGFPSKLNPFETVLTGDRGAETLLTSSPPE